MFDIQKLKFPMVYNSVVHPNVHCYYPEDEAETKSNAERLMEAWPEVIRATVTPQTWAEIWSWATHVLPCEVIGGVLILRTESPFYRDYCKNRLQDVLLPAIQKYCPEITGVDTVIKPFPKETEWQLEDYIEDLCAPYRPAEEKAKTAQRRAKERGGNAVRRDFVFPVSANKCVETLGKSAERQRQMAMEAAARQQAAEMQRLEGAETRQKAVEARETRPLAEVVVVVAEVTEEAKAVANVAKKAESAETPYVIHLGDMRSKVEEKTNQIDDAKEAVVLEPEKVGEDCKPTEVKPFVSSSSRIMEALKDGPLSKRELAEVTGLSLRNLGKRLPMLQINGFIALTIPDSPRANGQKYKLAA
jgi:hypothetical protein